MKWSDVSIDGVWTIVSIDREKGNAVELVLPPAALDIIRAQPHVGDNPHMFAAARGNGHIRGFSKLKRAFDSKLPEMPPWTLHDARRTARSLMARAGVRPEIAERVMGHAIVGVEAVYDRHGYSAEKADALKRLAGLIRDIVDPATKVVPIRRRNDDNIAGDAGRS